MDGDLKLHRKALGSQFFGKIFSEPPKSEADVDQASVLPIILDTGNGLYDVISEKLQKSMGLQVTPESITHVRCANNQLLSVVGRVATRMYLQIKKKGKFYALRPLVVRNLAHPVNLSSAFCSRHSAILHFREKLLKFPGESVKLRVQGTENKSAVYVTTAKILGNSVHGPDAPLSPPNLVVGPGEVGGLPARPSQPLSRVNKGQTQSSHVANVNLNISANNAGGNYGLTASNVEEEKSDIIPNTIIGPQAGNCRKYRKNDLEGKGLDIISDTIIGYQSGN